MLANKIKISNAMVLEKGPGFYQLSICFLSKGFKYSKRENFRLLIAFRVSS